MPADEEEQRRATLWKLVDTQCAQLSDSVAEARRPFLLALAWAFIWASALYSANLGHNAYLRPYYQELNNLAGTEESDEKNLSEFAKNKNNVAVGDNTKKVDDLLEKLTKKHDDSLKRLEPHCKDVALAWGAKFEIAIPECRRIIVNSAKRSSDAYYEATLISLPGGLGKFFIGDLAIVGQLGLLLILSWCFFATRRENHAVRAFVDMDAHSRNTGGWFPVTYILEPRGRFLLAEHFSYAYRSVAQRFVFLFSQHSKPLLAFTVLLCLVPALVASWNAYTDLQGLLVLLRFRGGILPTDTILLRMLAEVVLLVLIWIISYKVIRFDIETSALLNGWQLAVQDVWMATWAAARCPRRK